MIKVAGEVIKGKERGRILGFPTANIKLGEKLESGVYSGSVQIKDKNYPLAIFINTEGTLLEAYIFDFTDDIYGQNIEVEIGQKIREVMDFKNSEELIAQIKKDIEIISNIK